MGAGQRPLDDPATQDHLRESFRRLVGAIPYQFRHAVDGTIVTVVALDSSGYPIMLAQSGPSLS